MVLKFSILNNYYISDSYNEARKKLVDAEFTSTFETDTEMHKEPKKRKLKKPNRFDSDSSKSDNEDAVCNKIPSPPKLRTPTKNYTVLPKRPIMSTPCKPSVQHRLLLLRNVYLL